MKMQGKCEAQGGWERKSTTSRKDKGKAHMDGHDMVRRVDLHGQSFVWCRKCSGYARCRLGLELMNRCRAGVTLLYVCTHCHLFPDRR